MTTPSSEHRLESILHGYLQAIDRGENPDRQALLLAHPELRDELAEYFADASKLDRMAKSLKTASFGGGASGSSPSLGKIRYFDDYELLEEIARGGMGVVYRAKQVSLNRVVAVKMILKGELASEADLRRFRQEAEAAANLDHPNIVPIYEVGEHEGQQYFSMKLIETKAKTAHDSGDGSQRDVSQMLAKVARAVHHAHQRGILHRDLKPSNILIDKSGEPHVADFGLAKKVEGDDSATKSGAIVGTPAYMAPEQARAEKSLTTAVDVYSLGAILYEELTGRPPFRGEDRLSTLMKVVKDEPTKPRSHNPKIDRDLETICLKCLEKEPGKRYRSAGELADDLDRWERGEPIEARSIGLLERAVRKCRRNKVVTSACVLAAFGIGVGVFFAVNSQIREHERLRAELEQAQENRHQDLIRGATLARLAGERKTALTQLQEAAKLGAGNRDALHSETFISIAAPALRHRGQTQIAIGNLTPPHLSFSDDGTSVFLSYGGTRTVLSVPTTQVQRKEAGEIRLLNVMPKIKRPHDDKVVVRAVNAPATFALLERFVPGEDNDVSLWDIAQQKMMGSIPGLLGRGADIALSADGGRAAFINPYAPGTVHVWEFKESRIVATLPAGQHAVGMPLRFAAGFSPDGSLFALHGKLDGEPSLLVFDVNTSRLIGNAKNDPHVSAWSPDGRWLASWGTYVSSGALEAGAGNDVGNHARSTNVLLLSEVVHPVTSWISESPIKQLEFSADGTFLAADSTLLRTTGNERSMRAWVEKRDYFVGPFIRFPGAELKRSTRLIRSGNLPMTAPPPLTLSHPGFSEAPFAQKGKTTVARPTHFALHPDGKQFVAAFFLDHREDHPVNLHDAKTETSLESWDIVQGKRLAIWNNDATECFASLDYALGGECVLTTSNGGVKQWDAKTGRMIRHLPLPMQPNRLGGAWGDEKDGSVHIVWEFDHPLPLVLAPGGEHALIMTRIDSNSTDGKRYVYEQVHLRTGAKSSTIALSGYGPIALSRNGRLLAETQSGHIHLHDLETGKSLRWDMSGRDTSAIAFHPGGDVLATADSTGLVRLWHLGWIRSEAERIGIPLPGLTR